MLIYFADDGARSDHAEFQFFHVFSPVDLSGASLYVRTPGLSKGGRISGDISLPPGNFDRKFFGFFYPLTAIRTSPAVRRRLPVKRTAKPFSMNMRIPVITPMTMLNCLKATT